MGIWVLIEEGEYGDAGWGRHLQSPVENAQTRMKPQPEWNQEREPAAGPDDVLLPQSLQCLRVLPIMWPSHPTPVLCCVLPNCLHQTGRHRQQMRAGQDNVSRLKFRGGEGDELVALSAAPQGLAQSLLAYYLLGGE